MKTLLQQIQQIMEYGEQHVGVIEVRPVSLAKSDPKEFRQKGS